MKKGQESSIQKIEDVGKYGALLSLIEVGLGSLLHSFKVPFSGLFLSLNQGYLLCRVSIKTKDRTLAYSVSNVAAVLKSLAPAGNKLGPMLSLSMQGLLFTFGLGLGINPLGLSLGMALMSLWSFIQPLVTYYLFFGDKLIDSAKFIYAKTLPFLGLTEEALWWILSIVVMAKVFLGISLALVAWKKQGEDDHQERLTYYIKPKKTQHAPPVILALKDLTRPLFVFSLGSTAIFLWFSQHPWAQILWYLMRPLAIGFIFFYISRTLTLDRWLMKLQGSRFEVFGKGCELALSRIRKLI
jgi:hypothetical protein